MAISMFSSQLSPIAIDFGASSVKLVQVSYGETPAMVAVQELEVPDAVRTDTTKRIEFIGNELPRVIRKGKFRGRRVTFSIPSSHTFVTHLAVPNGADESYTGMHLHAQTGMPPDNMVIRTNTVKELHRDGATLHETICFAVPREVVMQHVEMLRKCKLEVSDVHTEQHAAVWAFNHIHNRAGDERITNLFVDIGWGSTKVGISHGKELVFARTIPIGGRHLDKQMAETLHCDLSSARAHRQTHTHTYAHALSRHGNPMGLANESGHTGSAILDTGMALAAQGEAATVAQADDRRQGDMPASLHTAEPTAATFAPDGVDFSELFESIGDDLQMCMRYHRGLFEDRPIDRIIFLGGESNNTEFCRAIAHRLNLPGMIGDPIGRMSLDDLPRQDAIKRGRVHPGWAVACGLSGGGAV